MGRAAQKFSDHADAVFNRGKIFIKRCRRDRYPCFNVEFIGGEYEAGPVPFLEAAAEPGHLPYHAFCFARRESPEWQKTFAKIRKADGNDRDGSDGGKQVG